MRTMRFIGALGLGLGLMFAGLGEADARPSKDQAKRAFEVLARGVKSSDFDTRATAVSGLGKAEKKLALPLIEEAMKDPQWRVRRAAIDALRELGDKRWESELGRAMCDAAIPVEDVLGTLGDLKTDAAVKVLTGNLGSKDCLRPERYPKALAEAGDALMVAAFKAALASKTEALRLPFEAEFASLPLPAALPLYKAAFPKASAALQGRIVERIAATDGLGEVDFVADVLKAKDTTHHFAVAEMLALRGNGKGRAVLQAAVKGGDGALRVRALKALIGIAGADEAALVKPFVEARETPYEELKLSYLILVKADKEKTIAIVEEGLKSTDAPQRAAAVRFLGRVRGTAALEELHKLLTGSADMVRQSAIEAVAELAARESIPHLGKALDLEGNREFKILLLNALAAIKDVDVLPVVRFQLVGGDAAVRMAALKALVSVPDKSSIQDLEAAAKDRLKEIREFALNALLDLDPEGRLELWKSSLDWIDLPVLSGFAARHGDKVRRHVEAALAHKRDEIRAAAFRAVSSLTVPVRVEVLQAVARTSKYAEQRVAAIDALVVLQKGDATTFLALQAASGDEVVRVRAIGHLGRLGHKEAEASLLGWLDDPNERIQVAAAASVLRL
jgi:HEAT repeat protein